MDVQDLLRTAVPDPRGTFTIRQILMVTNALYPNRYALRVPEKERMARMVVQEFTKFVWPRGPQTPGQPVHAVPQKYWRITTFLKPRYKKIRMNGNLRLLGRHIQNSYQIIFETDELSIDSRHWKIRLGSDREWQRAPQHALASLPPHERENNVDLQEWLRTRSGRQKLFLNSSDWNSMVLGINPDFLFRCSYVYKRYGHLHGVTRGLANIAAPVKTNPEMIMFFPKHILNFFETLMQMGVLKQGGQP